MASRVAVVACADYDQQAVSEAVARGIGLLGGASKFAGAGETLCLKPNLLVGATPESCVATHPTVFGAVAQLLGDEGAQLTYGDSPGFGRPDSVARKAGIAAVAARLGVAFADFVDGREVSFPEGALIRRWFFANGVLDSDGFVSLSKMKTHGLTRMTGAVKNQFGCIPGMRKGEFHARMNDIDRFCRMLVDLNRALPARLYVMDAIVAMQGNGPRNGDPRPMGVLLFSEDPVALDSVACRLMALDPALVGTCIHGEAQGLGTFSEVELQGDEIEPLVAEDFVVNRSTRSTTGSGSGRAARFMRRWVVPKPVIRTERCTACGTCVSVCPVEPKAVDWNTSAGTRGKQPPVHDYTRCIRCYCCQEMCPEKAIEIAVPPLGRLIHG